MSYVAIARKWRPTTFDDIAGQQHVTRTLCNAIRLGRIHHAFLFTGARGVGKTSAARVLARALNCVEGPTPTPCGACPSCTEILSGGSPDVIEIDGASNNSVEDIRELRESVRYLPQRGRRKVYIVDEVHMLSRGAFNALLKTLEEPPEHVVFIFATTEPQKIPDTILSRVQRFDFKRIPATVVVDTLARVCEGEGIEVPEGGLRLIARAGEGSMRDSQSLLDRVISFGGESVTTEQVAEVLGLVDRELLYTMLGGMLRGEADRCLDAIDRVYSFGFDLSEFTAEMLELLRNATLVGLSPSSRRYLDVPDEERGRLEELVGDVSTDVFVRSFQVMLEVHEQVARAPRPRMVLEMAVARLVSIRPARPVDQLVQRLGDIERRLRHGGVTARPRSGGPARSGGSRSADDDSEPHPARSGSRPAAPRPPAAAPPPAARPAPAPARPAPPPARPPAPQQRAAPPAPPPLVLQPPPTVAEEPEDDGLLDALPPDAFAQPADLFSDTRGLDATLDPEEEDGGLAPDDAPPPLPADASADRRFEVLQVWLEAGGPRYATVALDLALADVDTPTLRCVTTHELHLRHARGLLDDARVLRGLTTCFPACERLAVQLRSGEQPRTRRERLQAERAATIAELREALAQEELIRTLQERLDARLSAVALPDEPPAIARPPGSLEAR